MPEIIIPATPIKNNIPIPPPYPYYDDSNYLSSRNRSNILNIVNNLEFSDELLDQSLVTSNLSSSIGTLESDVRFEVREEPTSTVSRHWEYVNVSLTRVPGFGFGIAVSGGCDNPHFANGDPAIAISDMLKGGPAQGKLQINDRIVSANGISLDNVDYSTAVQILRDSGPSVNLRVKRRVNPQTYKVSVPLNSKRLKKLSFESLGFVVSLTLQIKTVDHHTLGLREGDLIDKIQGIKVQELFNEKLICKELKRVMDEGNSSTLNLSVKRSPNNRVAAPPQPPPQPTHSVGNLYVQPPTRNNNKSFDSTQQHTPPPPPPPRPPLPNEFEPPATTRSINFIKQNTLGIRLSGGNKSGIIVSAVQKNSQADLQGLTVNDKIVRVNEHDFVQNPPTREQAIELLSSIPNDTLVNLTVEKCSGNLSSNQDEFYIRTRVATEQLKLHDVLVVTDTLVNGLVGHWEAYRVDSTGTMLKHTKLIIPNMKNARELMKKSWKRTTSFRNREWEELLQVAPASEPYDLVEKSSLEVHQRPVVLYSPLNSQIIECLMMMKHATRLFKVIKNLDDIEFNDSRIRVVQELVSIKQLQEVYEKRVVPFVVFANFGSKDALKESCDGSKYSKIKKLYSVLDKVGEKLGSYLDLKLEALRDCESGAEKLYNALVQQQLGTVCFVGKSNTSSHTPSKTKSHYHHHHQNNNPTRPKSTDNLSPLMKFPNFNIPPPCSIIDQNNQPDYDKHSRVVQRSATTIGILPPPQSQPSTSTTPVSPAQNNFAHSPVFERREYQRAQSNPPPSRRDLYHAPPTIDRTKKPGGNGAFYPVNTNTALPGKPVPPPKPKLISKVRDGRKEERTSGDGDDEAGQTYLNIPMGSKVAQQQNVTSGYFDWRGGRLIQKNLCGGQIPIEVFIPEGAVPGGETVNVWFQIVDYNVRDADNTATPKKMLSPLVKFGPENYRFQIPVEIRIPQYSANSNQNDNMLAKVLMNNHSDYWTKIDIQNGNYQDYPSDVKIVSLTVQQF